MSELDRYSIILFDIDHFKAVNDLFGHQVGDEVLKFLSELVKRETRASDLCFRIGGEEFLIILPGSEVHITESVAERIRKTTEYTLSPSGKPITVSMGISSFPDSADSFSELMNKTDQALYKAKQEGRNRVVTAV
ncbi:GGDEF domain-containing protein [Cytobacillus sp. FSL H8-0458]|uniref:GGDEF domain-containing protein n=1 Tax=Cytobacillus sp. FSL H8-0458 TaxID=2975346 RepID=UPI004046D59E